MVSKSQILNRINPNPDEKYFYDIVSRSKSENLEQRQLTYLFMDEETSYPEAFCMANKLINWAEELELSYCRFEHRSKYSLHSSEEKFMDYCNKMNWSFKKNHKNIIARDKDRFKAKFELESELAHIILENDSDLVRIQTLNELGVE